MNNDKRDEVLKNMNERNNKKTGGYSHSNDGMKYIPEEEFAPTWYAGLCSKEEIERLISIKTPSDYLLKLRADQILDNTRLYRVILHRKRCGQDIHDVKSIFDDSDFENYYKSLPYNMKEKCKLVDKGFIFSNDPNGSYMKTDYGDLIIVSESLKYFLYYMNLSFFDFDESIPEDVRFSSLIIAIRIMLKSEALDFDMDPRGEIPYKIDYTNKVYVKEQIKFVIGHEYSHYLLGHLDQEHVYVKSLWGDEDNDKEKYKFYNYSQLKEFDADIASITNPIRNNEKLDDEVMCAISFFIYTEIYEQAKEQISPSISRIKTHPDPIDRIWNLYEKTKDKLKVVNKELIENHIKKANLYKEILQENIECNMDDYERYGSVYLGSWRGKVLIDRVDY